MTRSSGLSNRSSREAMCPHYESDMPHSMAVHLVPGIHRFRPEYFRSSYAVFRQRPRSSPGVLVIACSDPGTDPFRLIPLRPIVRYVHQSFGNLILPSKPGMRSNVDVLLE